LASSTACPHQAFRYGNNAWGLQFHPEVTEQIIRDWCAWDPTTRQQTEVLLAGFKVQQVNYLQTASRLAENFQTQINRLGLD
jgi:GMP synthase-like glutamine amidotransferase